MKIRVLLFGATADILGKRETSIDLNGASVNDLFDQLAQEAPALKQHKLLFAINEEYASPDRILSDGDNVAVFTAVSGG